MKKRILHQLGETEMEVMQHVWRLGDATVAEVHEQILSERKVAYTTVMTVMRKLSEKGFLVFEKEGMSYRYSPAQSQEIVQRQLLGDFVTKVFNGSPGALIQTLVRKETLSEEEKEMLQSLIKGLEEGDESTD